VGWTELHLEIATGDNVSPHAQASFVLCPDHVRELLGTMSAAVSEVAVRLKSLDMKRLGSSKREE